MDPNGLVQVGGGMRCWGLDTSGIRGRVIKRGQRASVQAKRLVGMLQATRTHATAAHDAAAQKAGPQTRALD